MEGLETGVLAELLAEIRLDEGRRACCNFDGFEEAWAVDKTPSDEPDDCRRSLADQDPREGKLLSFLLPISERGVVDELERAKEDVLFSFVRELVDPLSDIGAATEGVRDEERLEITAALEELGNDGLRAPTTLHPDELLGVVFMLCVLSIAEKLTLREDTDTSSSMSNTISLSSVL